MLEVDFCIPILSFSCYLTLGKSLNIFLCPSLKNVYNIGCTPIPPACLAPYCHGVFVYVHSCLKCSFLFLFSQIPPSDYLLKCTLLRETFRGLSEAANYFYYLYSLLHAFLHGRARESTYLEGRRRQVFQLARI